MTHVSHVSPILVSKDSNALKASPIARKITPDSLTNVERAAARLKCRTRDSLSRRSFDPYTITLPNPENRFNFSKEAQWLGYHIRPIVLSLPTRCSSLLLVVIQFRRRVRSRHDAPRRGVPIKPADSNEFAHRVRFHFHQLGARCIYVSIPCVRFGARLRGRTSGGAVATVSTRVEKGGRKASSGVSRIRSWAGSFGAKPDRLTQLGFITGSAASLAANICNT